MCMKIFVTFFALLVVICAILLGILFKSSPPSIDVKLFTNEVEKLKWSSVNKIDTDTSIRPFQIKIDKDVIDDLKRRLNNVRLNEPLDGIEQQYGMNTKLLRDVIEYWKTKYNWIEREQYLNQYPQFKTNIQGLDIHFIHIKPDIEKGSNIRVLPLLMLHGWPGSVREFYDIIPLLTKPRNGYHFVFELIIPSLPGYGFSQAATIPGFGPNEIAVLFKLLMDRLRIGKYYVQGGDFGATIIQSLAKLYPEKILGIHSNMCLISTSLSFLKELIISFYPTPFGPKEFIENFYPLSQRYQKLLLETGYLHLQATKPDTVGVALGDSPAGLAAYILEKFTTATNPNYRQTMDGGLKESFTYDSLLDNIMYYWLNNAMTTSMRLYSETFNKKYFTSELKRVLITPPTACAAFLNEITYQPEFILREVFSNIIQMNTFTKGGHFAAMENPNLLADDIFLAINKMLK